MSVPTLFLIHSVRRLFRNKIKLEILSCSVSYQVVFTWFHNLFLVAAGLAFLIKRHPIISQRFSFGDKSGEREGQGLTFKVFLSKSLSVSNT